MFKRIFFLSISLVIIISFFACSKGTKNEKVMIIGIVQTLPSLDPAMHRDRTVESVLKNMFDSLTTRDKSMDVVPQLAESWGNVDDLTWEFKLRKGVKFHNGDKLTAQDVKFSIDRIIKPNSINGKSSPRKGLIDPVVSADVVDDSAILIKTSKPWSILPVMLSFIEIVPKNYIMDKGDDYFANHPIGTGPFRFVEWVKGERLIMERFDDYYGGSPSRPPVGKAKIARIVFKPIPEPSSRIAALKAGETHLVQNLPAHLINEVSKDSMTKVLHCDGTRSFFLGMNYNVAPFDNISVRKAIAHAINKDAIVESILENMAITISGPLVPKAFGYNEDIKPYKFDPNLAKKMLNKAGYGKGFEVELDTDQDSKEIAEAIAANLSKVGIKVKTRIWEWGVLKPQLERNKRSMFIFSWGNASLDPVGILIPVFMTNERGNYMGYSNLKVDKLLKMAETGMDPELRKDQFKLAQTLIYEDAPVVFLFSPKEIYGVRATVKGWEPTPDGRIDMHDTYLANN